MSTSRASTRLAVLLGATAALSLALRSEAKAAAIVAVPDATLAVSLVSETTTPVTTIDNQTAKTGITSAQPFVPGTGNSVGYLVATESNGVLTSATLSTPGALTIGGGGNSASFTPTGTPAPAVRAATVAAPSSVGGEQAAGTLTYAFEVVSSTGATGTARITVNATGAVSAQNGVSPLQFNRAFAQLTIPGIPALNDNVQVEYSVSNGNSVDDTFVQGAGFESPNSVVGPAGSLISGGFNEDGTYTVNLGRIYDVVLSTFVSCGNVGGSTCSASIDPVISDDSPDSSLVFSAGLGDSVAASAVPEPSTWAMMLLGVGGIGFMAHRRRSKPASLAA